jgi:hypothetical protein
LLLLCQRWSERGGRKQRQRNEPANPDHAHIVVLHNFRSVRHAADAAPAGLLTMAWRARFAAHAT